MLLKRIKQTPFTVLFLIIGFVFAMFLVSIQTSFVASYIGAQREKEDNKPPNGTQYLLSWKKTNNIRKISKPQGKTNTGLMDEIGKIQQITNIKLENK